MNSGRLDTIADAFVCAATGSLPWEAAMETAGQATGSIGAIMLPIEGNFPRAPFNPTSTEAFEAYFNEGWINRDERHEASRTLIRQAVVTDLDFTDADRISRSPYYQELLGRFDMRWFGGVKIAAAGEIWCLAIQRTIEQGPFQKSAIRQLAALSPRLSSAAALARALGFARAESAAAAFEASGMPVVLLDRFGQVQSTNPSAERLFGPHLNVTNRRLTSWSHEATRNLDRALHALYWESEALATALPVILPRPEGRPTIAYPCRLPTVTNDPFGPAKALVVLNDLESRPLAKEDVLRLVFGLTPAEARFAAHFGRGESVRMTADTLGVSYETARWTLKAVFQKTSTYRQTELATLLERVAKAPG